MCVIMIADESRPTDEMVEKAFDNNNAGAGIAWREDGTVCWEKGIEDVADVKEMCKTLPTPYIVHFRIPSEGGKRKSLCHPFPIEHDVPLDLTGSTKGYVLFHNGHWNDWRKWVLETAFGKPIGIPGGKWSDTRGMAFVASYYGLGILDMINEKAIAFGPDECEVIAGSGWTKEEGVWCSNMFWKHTIHRSYNNNYQEYNRICSFGQCHRYDTDSDGRCPEHRKELPVIAAGEKATPDASVPSEEDSSTITGNMFGDKSLTPAFRGDATKLPFDEAWKLFQKGELSKKQFKKARRAYEQQLREGKVLPFRLEGIVMGPKPSENLVH